MNGRTGKLFRNGASQAVRLPKEFRFKGDRVRVRRTRTGVLLEPMIMNVREWFKELDKFSGEPFMPEGRDQPTAPVRKVFR